MVEFKAGEFMIEIVDKDRLKVVYFNGQVINLPVC